MAPKDLDTLIEKYLAGKCSQEELHLVESLYASLGNNPALRPKGPSDNEALSAQQRMLRVVEDHASKTVELPARRRSDFWSYTGIAASLIMVLATVYYFNRPAEETQVAEMPVQTIAEFKEITNTTDISRRVILPDGSIVQMSPESSVRYLNSNEETSRELFLKGEAYFDIAHDPSRPFYVYAGDIITKVLGTSFIIRAPVADEKVIVSVKTGKVTVYSKKNSHKKTVLTPNQEAVYDHSTDLVATQEVPVARLKEENRNFTEMVFEETPVSEVLALLTKSYDIDIEFNKDDLSGCVLTSSFFEEGLYDRIDVICTAIGATYNIVDTRIIIESKGCNLKPD